MNKFLSKLVISFAAIASLTIFTWPMLIGSHTATEASFAQGVFIGLMPLILIVILVEFASGGIDSRQLAILGVLSALNAVIRMLGAGTGGVETAFFVIIIAAYIFGASFGFILGAISILVSSLLTGGIGPWLPFQMMAAGLVGIGAGLLPKVKAKFAQITILILFSAVAAFAYGALMTIWNWPFLAGVGSSLSYLPGGGLLENFSRFVKYEIFTGGLVWDLGRAITTIVLIVVTAPALLATLKRAASRAGFETS